MDAKVEDLTGLQVQRVSGSIGAEIRVCASPI